MAEPTAVAPKTESISIMVTYFFGLLLRCGMVLAHVPFHLRASVSQHSTFFTLQLFILVALFNVSSQSNSCERLVTFVAIYFCSIIVNAFIHMFFQVISIGKRFTTEGTFYFIVLVTYVSFQIIIVTKSLVTCSALVF